MSSQWTYSEPVGFRTPRSSSSRTAIIVRCDRIDFPCTTPAASIAASTRGSRSAISPCQATSTSLSVQVSLNAAPAAFEPIGAS